MSNYVKGTGKLVVDRYDFQKHIDGENFRQNANTINLSPIIDGYTNVQQILENLAIILSPSIIPDATVSTKGIIKLSGDISGTASSISVTKLRGYSVSFSSPTSGDIMSYNGSAWINIPSPAFSPFGDLYGSSSLQRVQSLTGDATYGITSVLGPIIQFEKSVNPSIKQETATTIAGKDFTISAQSTSAGASNGGSLVLKSGTSTTSYAGDIYLSNGNNISIQSKLLNSGKHIIALCTSSVLTNTEMPAGTGDDVIYIANATTDPTTSPTSGSILYSSSGVLCIKQSDGTQFRIGDIPNPFNWGALSTSSSQIKISRDLSQSYSATPTTFTYALNPNSTTMVDLTLIGKETISNNTAIWRFIAAYVTYDGYDSGNAHIVGTVTTTSIPASPPPSWGVPTLTVSGTNLIITSAAATGETISWVADLKLSICQTI